MSAPGPADRPRSTADSAAPGSAPPAADPSRRAGAAGDPAPRGNAAASDARPPGRDSSPRGNAAASDARTAGPLRRTISDAALALSFLTLVPVPGSTLGAGSMRRAAGWFPLIGAGIGAFGGAVRLGTEPLLGATTATVLGLAAIVAVTGALHQDGLADCADGLGVRGDRERRLAVMRDSAIGVFGMLALLGWGLLMVSALAPLSKHQALDALIAAGALGRAATLVHATVTTPARRDGLGAGFTVPPAALGIAVVTAAAAALLALGPARAALALGAAALTAAATSVWARRAIGGRTGDTLGATVALAELLVVLALAAAWH
ncbi:MAG TPA: adenosylcobinamide-GDP ribazoletransferase [Conexibacter sp.]